MIVMLDTSMWTHSLRKLGGDPQVKARVEELLRAGLAAWCDVVRVELWAGVRNDAERGALRDLTAAAHRLAIDDAVWDRACETASFARDQGLTAPANDFVIHACAAHHGVSLEYRDEHFAKLDQLLRQRRTRSP